MEKSSEPILIVLDAHGVLLDDSTLAFLAIQDMYIELGVEPPGSFIEYLFELRQDGWDQELAFIRRGRRISSQTLYAHFLRTYSKRLSNATPAPLIPGVIDLLRALKKKGVPVLLVSHHSGDLMRETLRKEGAEMESFITQSIFDYSSEGPWESITWEMSNKNIFAGPQPKYRGIFISQNPLLLSAAIHTSLISVGLITDPALYDLIKLSGVKYILNDIRNIAPIFL